MRFFLEHQWAASLSVAAIGAGFLWVGMRENLVKRMIVGILILMIAIIIWCIGFFIETPSEHATKIVRQFVNAVVEGDLPSVALSVANEVILVDSWNKKSGTGRAIVLESVRELHQRHSMTQVTILKCEPVEREGDVQVELVVIARVSGIGTVPSTWRLFVDESGTGNWEIYSIDAIEIAGRSFR